MVGMPTDPRSWAQRRLPRPGGAGVLARLHLDGPLLTGLLLLCGFGLIVLFSASDRDLGAVERQGLRLALAF